MPELLHRGRYVELVAEGRWEFARRVGAGGVVAVVAFTEDDELLLVEQHRPPLDARVLELPAGLAGDRPEHAGEPMVRAAARELLEETGYEATRWRPLGDTPVSAGMTDEVVHFFAASGLVQRGPGGGDSSESIVVHRVPRRQIRAFLAERRGAGVYVDAKIGGGLWMADERS